MSGEPLSAWDRFWRYDRISSFHSAPGAANYGPPIADGWSAFFAALPDRARILDLCTGNGAIAVMAVAAGKSFAVTGADLADVEPTAFVTRNLDHLKQVTFLARTPAEKLPLADGGIDAVVSQYGIEYSDLARSLPEAVRVLAPGGRLRLAMHATEGTVARDTRTAIADAEFLLGLDLVARAAEAESDGPTAFNAALKAIADRAPTATDQAMLANVHRSLCDTFDHRRPALAATAELLVSEIRAHHDRQSALLAAAQSLDAMHRLAARLVSVGMAEVIHTEQRDGADLIGHVIEAHRP